MNEMLFDHPFWSKVDIQITGCWNWTGYVEGEYGKWQPKGMDKRAHRWAWFFTYGWLPETPLQINHSCNNGICVRPDHLYVGTQYDNIQDQIARGTHSKAGRK